MASSLGIHLGGNRCLDNSNPVIDHHRRQKHNLCCPSSNQSDRLCFPVIGSRAEPKRKRSISLFATARASLEMVGRDRRRSASTAATAYEKLDGWMSDSVGEIVKNLREAPLLVHVYGAAEKPRLETEKAVEKENWEELRRKWEGGVAPYPDGLIFVEELIDDDEGDNSNGNADCGGTKFWGLVVQGKGVESGPACYLLKTSRVNSGSGCGFGMGLGCTHFTLLPINDLGETAQSQLKNCWLLEALAQ